MSASEASEAFAPETEHAKCAPSKPFEGTCYSMDSLRVLALAYNNHAASANARLKTSMPLIPFDRLTKPQLLNEILNAFSGVCNRDQLCWLDQHFVKVHILNLSESADAADRQMADEIMKNTFRPLGPQTRFKWLNTVNINDIMEQYESKYTDFKFFGAVPMNFKDLGLKTQSRPSDYQRSRLHDLARLSVPDLLAQGKTKIGIVFNLDEHWEVGSHWVALFADFANKHVYFFDSYGTLPDDRYVYKPSSGTNYVDNRILRLMKSIADQLDGVQCLTSVGIMFDNTPAPTHSQGLHVTCMEGGTSNVIQVTDTTTSLVKKLDSIMRLKDSPRVIIVTNCNKRMVHDHQGLGFHVENGRVYANQRVHAAKKSDAVEYSIKCIADSLESVPMHTMFKGGYKSVTMDFNRLRHQYGGSECGVYSTSFILRMLQGETFEQITGKRVSDSKVNECRKTFFRFK